jgi:hypothetical protein
MDAAHLPSHDAREFEGNRNVTGLPNIDNFSLVQGGPIYRFQVVVGMAMPDRLGVLRRAVITTILVWLPLLLLSAAQDLALGTKVEVPFLHDFAANIRFLIALPLLIVAEAVVDPRLGHSVKHFVRSGLVGRNQLTAFGAELGKIIALRDGMLPSLVIVLAAFLPSIWVRHADLPGRAVTNWHMLGMGSELSLAGWWYAFVGLPLFRLLLFRWLWLTVLWALLIRRVTRLPLGCVPSHPDGAAGLGFLKEAQTLFGLVALASSAAVAGGFANGMIHGGQTLTELKFQMITFCVFLVVLLSAPLLVVTPKLLRLKKEGLFDYGSLGTAYAQGFDRKWINGKTADPGELLGSSDIQSLADLRSSFDLVQGMKTVLIDKKVLIGLTIPVLIPMIPVLLIATPADKLIRDVLKLLV